jgi:hypothetical protein
MGNPGRRCGVGRAVIGFRGLCSGVALVVLAVGYLVRPQPGVDPATPVLPPIVMPAHGGLELQAEQWSIAPDGSWVWQRVIRSRPPRTVSRSGTLSAVQLRGVDPAVRVAGVSRATRRRRRPCR